MEKFLFEKFLPCLCLYMSICEEVYVIHGDFQRAYGVLLGFKLYGLQPRGQIFNRTKNILNFIRFLVSVALSYGSLFTVEGVHLRRYKDTPLRMSPCACRSVIDMSTTLALPTFWIVDSFKKNQAINLGGGIHFVNLSVIVCTSTFPMGYIFQVNSSHSICPMAPISLGCVESINMQKGSSL